MKTGKLSYSARLYYSLAVKAANGSLSLDYIRKNYFYTQEAYNRFYRIYLDILTIKKDYNMIKKLKLSISETKSVLNDLNIRLARIDNEIKSINDHVALDYEKHKLTDISWFYGSNNNSDIRPAIQYTRKVRKLANSLAIQDLGEDELTLEGGYLGEHIRLALYEIDKELSASRKSTIFDIMLQKRNLAFLIKQADEYTLSILVGIL